MNFFPVDLLLADDDEDDCLLFKEALEELPLRANLSTVRDGEQLMYFLSKSGQLPSMLFLDLNMPRKNGFECLVEIRQIEKYNSFPVVIYSTSFDEEIVDQLYKKGAQYYIRKPAEFSKLKQVIYEACTLITQTTIPGIEKRPFILHA